MFWSRKGNPRLVATLFVHTEIFLTNVVLTTEYFQYLCANTALTYIKRDYFSDHRFDSVYSFSDIRAFSDSRGRLVAGSSQGYSGHVDGKPIDARFKHPKGVTMDDKGNVYVADTANMAIRKIGEGGQCIKLLVMYLSSFFHWSSR